MFLARRNHRSALDVCGLDSRFIIHKRLKFVNKFTMIPKKSIIFMIYKRIRIMPMYAYLLQSCLPSEKLLSRSILCYVGFRSG